MPIREKESKSHPKKYKERKYGKTLQEKAREETAGGRKMKDAVTLSKKKMAKPHWK